jgi:hypothetical protein
MIKIDIYIYFHVLSFLFNLWICSNFELVVLDIPFSPSIILVFGLGCGMQKKL